MLFINNVNLFTVALMALKRKKAYESNIEKINGARMTIETQMMAIENANVNLETMGAMRAGAEAMKNIHGSMYVIRFYKQIDLRSCLFIGILIR